MMPLFFIITFGVIGIGMALVVYGTIAKNRWGINLDPVSCPRCNTQLPQIRQPQDLRQRMWGGGTCPSCGVEVDKWGREIACHPPRSSTISVGGHSQQQLLRTHKIKFLIISASTYFLLTLLFKLFNLTLLFNWLGIEPAKVGLPFTLGVWLVLLRSAVVDTAIFTALFYFGWFHLVPWISHSIGWRKLQ